MARAKQSVDDSVSLFPFLSILACVIGILVLMITAITLGQIGQDTVQAADAAEAAKAEAEAQARIEEYKKLRAALAADLENAKQLESLVQNAAAVRKNLEEVRAELKTLEAKRAATTSKLEKEELERADKLAEANRLKNQIAALEKQLAPLAEQIKKLRAELAKRTAPPEAAQVKILPSGSGTDLDATFVECAQASIVLYEEGKETRVPIAQTGSSKEFAALLAGVKAKKNGTVIFLVRPDGVGTYNTARNIARGRGVLNGKLAIAGQGKLDLSLFKGKP
jgi:predicted RNase H-like nuclease (RuvC/YqgF family)